MDNIDYEKAYKAVLQTATQWIKDGCTDKEKICLECVFPELRESEDERIRKILIETMACVHPSVFSRYGIKVKQAISYLEKQKESLHVQETRKENADSFTDGSEDERTRKEIIGFIQSQIEDGNSAGWDRWITWLEKHKEHAEGDFARGYDSGYEACLHSHGAEWFEKQNGQKYTHEGPFTTVPFHKPEEGVEYDMYFEEAQKYIEKRGFDIPWNDCDVFIDKDYITQTVANVLKWADEHPIEQKPAENPKKEHDYCIGFTDGKREVLDNPKRYGLQEPAEWSEEDEKMLTEIINDIKCGTDFNIEFQAAANKRINWIKARLKSLCPQSHWKPSEEDLQCIRDLKEVITSYTSTRVITPAQEREYLRILIKLEGKFQNLLKLK